MFSGAHLRYMRVYQRMTQKELAEKLHISPATVSAYEHGKRCPDLYTLRQMCLLFQCSLAVFLEEDAELPSKADYEAIKRFGTLKPETRRLLFQIIDTLTQA